MRLELQIGATLVAGAQQHAVVRLEHVGVVDAVFLELSAVEVVMRRIERSTMQLSVLLAERLMLAGPRFLVASFVMPAAARPSYAGVNAVHAWSVCVRAEEAGRSWASAALPVQLVSASRA